MLEWMCKIKARPLCNQRSGVHTKGSSFRMPDNTSTLPQHLTFYGRHWKKRRSRGEGAVPPNTPNSRRCPKCKVWRPDETFGKCKTCQSCRDAGKEYHLEHLEDHRLRDRLRYYNLTAEQYKAMLEMQKDECIICGNPEKKQHSGETYAISIDHNHETGRVRGLLCADCNLLVSRIERIDMGLLMRVVDYIKADKGTEAK